MRLSAYFSMTMAVVRFGALLGSLAWGLAYPGQSLKVLLKIKQMDGLQTTITTKAEQSKQPKQKTASKFRQRGCVQLE